MLQQHAAVGVEREQPGGTEPPPVPLPGRRDDPRVAGIARAERAARLTGCGRLDRHLPSLVTRACHRLADRTAASAGASARRGEEYEDGDDDYELDDDPARIPRDRGLGVAVDRGVLGPLAHARRIEAQLDSAWRVVGAYRAGTDELVGFARAASDGVGFAYLADVFVLAEHQGHGLGKRLMHTMIEDGPGREFRWVLFTADAHGLYEQFGFAAPDATAMVRPPAKPAIG